MLKSVVLRMVGQVSGDKIAEECQQCGRGAKGRYLKTPVCDGP